MRICPKCRYRNPEDRTTCKKCGAELPALPNVQTARSAATGNDASGSAAGRCLVLGCAIFSGLTGLVLLFVYWPVGLTLLIAAIAGVFWYASDNSGSAAEPTPVSQPTSRPGAAPETCGGLISFFGLQQWWFTAFSPAEREYMTATYAPVGATSGCLSKGSVANSTLRLDVFLNSLASWFPGPQGIAIRKRIFDELATLTIADKHDKPGEYQGRDYTTYVEDIKQHARDGDLDQEEKELLGIIKTMERKARKPKIVKMNFGPDMEYTESVAPWYYWRLAVLYRKKKDYAAEIAIIERHFSVPHTDGTRARQLRERLPKAQSLLEKQRAASEDAPRSA